MITCPLCQQLVHLSRDERDTTTWLTEDDKQDFTCPTKTNPTSGVVWNHYQRHSNLGYSCQVYQAIIMPFRIIWKVTGELKVDEIIRYSEDAIFETKPLLRLKTHDYNEFVSVCQRFKNLRVFT